MKTKLLSGITLASVLLVGAACTNKQGETESPVFITVNLAGIQPLIVSVAAGLPVQLPTIELTSRLKDATASDPQHFADVQLSFYTVEYFRQDGGTMVPPTQTFAVGELLPSGGTVTLNNFPILTGAGIQQSPFDQLLSFNSGIDRETGLSEIHMFYRLTFFGDTVSGHRVQSETLTGDFIAQ